MLYQYKAKDQKGVLREGEIEAETKQAAYSALKEKGLFALSISEKKAGKKIVFELFGRVSLKDLAIFTKELQVMLKAGLSIVSALKAQGEQAENKKLSKIAFKLSQMVEGGMPLSEALAAFPSTFPNLYINTVKSGEKSGKLDDVLLSLTEQLEKDYELNSKIRGAMIYPAFILCVLFGVLVIILVYVMPALTKLFEELGGTLPITTRILIKFSKFILKYWWLLLIALFGLIAFLRLYKQTKTGAYLLDSLKIKMPIFGPLLKKIYMARFCRTTSTLIKSGLPVLEVLKTAKMVVTNVLYQEDIEKIEKQVENGLTLSLALKETKHFPTMVFQLVSAGEASGNMEESLDTLADYFDKEVATSTAALASLIEPILIIIIGVAVGLAVISVIKPIYSLSEIM